MTAETATAVKEVGFWGVVIVLLIQNLAIPVLKKYLPTAQKAKIEAEQFERELRLRQVSANENIAKVLTISCERLDTMQKTLVEYGHGQNEMLKHMAVLLDRKEQTTNNKKGGMLAN